VLCLRFACLVALSIALPLSAQDSAVTSGTGPPFRSGQWGAQFAINSSFASLGLLRFTSPRSAWVLDVRGSGGHAETELTYPLPGGGDTTITYSSSQARVAVRVGRRFYRGVGGPVASFGGVGVTGGYDHVASYQPGGPGSSGNGWNAGAFAELGAAYFVTDQLSVGATGSVAFSYGRSTTTGAPGRRDWHYEASAPDLAIVAALYF
jgi:hypothetical protein